MNPTFLDNIKTDQPFSLGMTQEAASGDATRLPPDFDWHACLYWYPELGKSGVLTEVAAKRHYLRHGHTEGRLYKRYCMVMLYHIGAGECSPLAFGRTASCPQMIRTWQYVRTNRLGNITRLLDHKDHAQNVFP